MTRGGESLHNELPGVEKPEVSCTRNPKVPKTEVSKNPKSTEPSRAHKIHEIENIFINWIVYE